MTSCDTIIEIFAAHKRAVLLCFTSTQTTATPMDCESDQKL